MSAPTAAAPAIRMIGPGPPNGATALRIISSAAVDYHLPFRRGASSIDCRGRGMPRAVGDPPCSVLTSRAGTDPCSPEPGALGRWWTPRPHSEDPMITLRRLAAILTLPIAVGACHDNGPTTPPKLATCSPAARIAFERMAAAGVSAATGTLVPLQGATASAAELPSCLQLVSDGGTYLVVPQFAADSGPFVGIDYSIANQPNGAVGSLRHLTVSTTPRVSSVQLSFDSM